MLGAIAFLVIAQPVGPTMAFTARFYAKGNTKTAFQLYVSDADGQNRQLLKTSGTEPSSARWVGTNMLAFVTKEKFGSETLWISPIRPWKPRALLTSKLIYAQPSVDRTTAPGAPIYIDQVDGKETEMRIDPATGELGKPKPDPLVWSPDLTSPEVDTAVELISPISTKVKLRFTGDAVKLVSEAEETDLGVLPKRIWNRTDQGLVWFSEWDHNSTQGNVAAIAKFDWKAKKVVPVFEEVNAFDFWPDRAEYAYTTARGLSDFEKKQVWTSELWVGDWKKGTKKKVISAVSWVSSVSLRR